MSTSIYTYLYIPLYNSTSIAVYIIYKQQYHITHYVVMYVCVRACVRACVPAYVQVHLLSFRNLGNLLHHFVCLSDETLNVVGLSHLIIVCKRMYADVDTSVLVKLPAHQ